MNSERTEYPVEVIAVDKIPEDLLSGRWTGRGQGKWEWLRKLIVYDMTPFAEQHGNCVRRITFPNKKEMQGAQAAAQGVSPAKADREGRQVVTKIKNPQLRIRTRSKPVSPNPNGEYYLWIEVLFKGKAA